MKMLDNYFEDSLYAADIPLSKLQFVTLKIISRNNGSPQNKLAHLCGKDKTTLTRHINTLERKQLVVRSVSSQDRRVKLIEITPKGTELLQQAQPVIGKIIQHIETNLSEAERATFKDLLQKIRTQIPSEFNIE
jgi:DNA-binding MarR family transcriptional regulator